MLKIAIVDHHLNNYHADTFIKILHELPASEETSVVAAYESHPSGDDWCAKHAVKRADSPEEAAKAADAILLLAPDDIDAHLGLATPVLAFGKPVFLDKLLANSLSDASTIVGLARHYNAPIFSSSALRHAVELDPVLHAVFSEAFARGMGTWIHYGMHTLSLLLRLMGSDIRRVCDTGTETARVVALEYSDGRRAHLDVRSAADQYELFPWVFAGRLGDRYIGDKVTDYSGFYRSQLQAVVEFFKTSVPPARFEESLATVAVLQAAERSRLKGGIWQETGI
jgi:predicted dehydrogenase